MQPEISAHPSSTTPATDGRWFVLLWLSIGTLLVFSLWFSASAVVPALAAVWKLDANAQSGLTIAVQLGFVVGSLLSALFNIADAFSTRRFMVLAALLGAATNAAVALVADSAVTALFFRFLTGMCMAGIYAPAVKLARTWFRRDFGVALGLLGGAIVLGNAAPQLVRAVGLPEWEALILTTSGLAVIGALCIALLTRDGPYALPHAQFRWRYALEALKDERVRLANFGYFGHMWELFAVYSWLPVFLVASQELSGMGGDTRFTTGLIAFVVIGSGALGSWLAGVFADRLDRPLVTMFALAASGVCCLFAGAFFGASLWVLVPFLLVWGITIVADSAQFSAMVAEFAEPKYVGTAATAQQLIGFLITIFSIRLIPELESAVGWRYAFVALIIGPLFGIIAMLRLRHIQRKPFNS